MGRIIPYIMDNKKCLKPPTMEPWDAVNEKHIPCKSGTVACRSRLSEPASTRDFLSSVCPSAQE
jgi:hypothetical protein